MNFLGTPNAIERVDRLHWRAFEQLVQHIEESKGFECRYVGGIDDHGADIVAAKNGKSYAIQVKHRADGHTWVGEQALRAVVTAVPVYECARGVVVTNSTFAPGMHEIAHLHKVILHDRDWLIAELASFCALCGEHVSAGVRDWCAGHALYRGNTYCIEHQRHLNALLRPAEVART